ncbi:MAG TPA: DNA gyrase inhibitor YacG [Pirellulales bacterium]|nr:DNA gyrase inhibitor YacG [Pirellulales bacterium]
MPQIRCPICDKRFESGDSPSPPFCSDRCRLIDLGRWLGESYGVPVQPDDEETPEVDLEQ